MKSKRSLQLAAVAAFASLIGSLLNVTASAQDTRPRYTSTQSADQSWTIPPDTVIPVQMNATLTSRTAHVGDKFTATVTVPVYVNGQTVIPAGAIVEGRITQVTPAKRMNRAGTIGVDFDDIVFPNGSQVGLVGSLTSSDPSTRKRIDDEGNVSGEGNKKPAVFVGGGGAVGAVLGGISGGAKGAVLGGVAGAGAGVASVLLSKGEEAQVPAGTPFGVQLKQPLIIRETIIAGVTRDRSQDQQVDRSAGNGDPGVDRSADRSAERSDRSDSVNPPPDNTDRSAGVNNSEPENRTDTDKANSDSPADLPLSSPEMVRRAQLALKDQGYYEGEADGVMNARTSGALRSFQKEHNLQVTGDLDPQTAAKLRILDSPPPGSSKAERSTDKSPDRSSDRSRSESAPENRSGNAPPTESVRASVLSATANRTPDGAIFVTITTQANSGGWRFFGEHVVNGDTLEVYARAIKPGGMSTQVLTRGKIELLVKDGVQYVRRVVVHSASADQEIALSGRPDSRTDSAGSGRTDSRTDPSDVRRTDSRVDPPAGGRPDSRVDPAGGGRSDRRIEPVGVSNTSAPSATVLQQKAEDLLAEYQRLYGVRMTGTGVEVDNAAQYREPEIELLFAIDSFANAAQLYSRLTASLRDRQSMRGATLAMAKQARRTDRIISTTNSRAADALAIKWDSLRLDVLKLMQTYNISSSEIEN